MSHLGDVFIKWNNERCNRHALARASEQWYISIYIFLWMKTFLKTGVYIYIYIYIYILLYINTRKHNSRNYILRAAHIVIRYFFLPFHWPRANFFFVPANSYQQIMVCSCAILSICVLLPIKFCSCVIENHTLV